MSIEPFCVGEILRKTAFFVGKGTEVIAVTAWFGSGMGCIIRQPKECVTLFSSGRL